MQTSLPFEVLYEDNHLIAVNKPVNLLVQGDSSGDPVLPDLVKEYIRAKYNKPGRVYLGVVHRLDRTVSGVVLFARTGKALSRMNEMFRNKQVEKKYWAIVKRLPGGLDGELKHYLVKNQQQNKSYAYDKPVRGAKEAVMRYRLIGSSDRYHLLEIELLTGRHHQIRVQLSALGCPVRGDLKYGYPRSNPDGGISLHARELGVIHPVKKQKISFVAPLPEEKLWQVFAGMAENG